MQIRQMESQIYASQVTWRWENEFFSALCCRRLCYHHWNFSHVWTSLTTTDSKSSLMATEYYQQFASKVSQKSIDCSLDLRKKYNIFMNDNWSLNFYANLCGVIINKSFFWEEFIIIIKLNVSWNWKFFSTSRNHQEKLTTNFQIIIVFFFKPCKYLIITNQFLFCVRFQLSQSLSSSEYDRDVLSLIFCCLIC